MKNRLWEKYTLISLIALSYTLISCKKEAKERVINPVTYKSYEEQVLYVQSELKSIAQVINKISGLQAGFNQQVRDIAAKKFDGNTNVLIKTIVESRLIASSDLERELKEKLKSFEGIEGHNYYPQIFIPRLEADVAQKQKFTVSVDGGTNTEDQPIYVFYDGNEEINAVEGYVNSNGELQRLGFLIDEEFADDNEVWVLSLNENVDDFGNYSAAPISEIAFESTPPPGPPADPTNISYQIGELGISCLKESWLAGKSDVAIRATRLTWNGKADGNYLAASVDYGSQRTIGDFRGVMIHQFLRSEVWNGAEYQRKALKFSLEQNWKLSSWFTQPVIYSYVIFERDNWPTALKTTVINPFFANFGSNNAYQRFFTFRSADPEYIVGSFYASKAGWPSGIFKSNHEYYSDNTLRQAWESNSCIKFNIIQY